MRKLGRCANWDSALNSANAAYELVSAASMTSSREFNFHEVVSWRDGEQHVQDGLLVPWKEFIGLWTGRGFRGERRHTAYFQSDSKSNRATRTNDKPPRPIYIKDDRVCHLAARIGPDLVAFIVKRSHS